MSRLAEKIRNAGRRDSGPIGFGVVATQRRPSPTLLCLLRLDKDQLKGAGKAAADADAVIIVGLEERKLGDALKALGGVPAGVRPKDTQRETVAAARDAGADFVLLDEECSAEAVLEEKVGLVLRLSGEVRDMELRALAGLPLDALEIPTPAEPLTIRRLIELRRLSLLTQTPLLVEVSPEVQPSRLQTLRDGGVAGVILDWRHAGRLGALREAILSLPARSRRREERGEAILPSLAGVPEAEEDEPDIE